MNLNIFKNRNVSSYFTAGCAILSIVVSIVYAVCYHNLARFMSWGAFALLLAGGIVALGLWVFNKKLTSELASGVLALTSLIGLCLFVTAIYRYVIIVMVGIDLDHFDPEFIACTTLFIVTLVASIIAVFLPKTKENA